MRTGGQHHLAQWRRQHEFAGQVECVDDDEPLFSEHGPVDGDRVAGGSLVGDRHGGHLRQGGGCQQREEGRGGYANEVLH